MAEQGDSLSERELAVLERLTEGGTNREIARDLGISHNTVKVHLRNIFAKLDVSSRTEASTVALQRGLVALPGGQEEQEAVTPSVAASDSPVAKESPDRPAGIRRLGRWWVLAAGLFLLMLGLVGVVAGLELWQQRQADNAETAAPATPFQERALGQGQEWFAAADLPQPKANMAMAAVGLELYLIGGEVEAGVSNLVEVYDTRQGRWRTASSKPTAVAQTGAAVLFGEIYVPGGRLADGRPTAVVEAYSPANDAWRPVTPLPRPLAGGVVFTDGRLLHVLGGWDGQSYVAEGYTYDPDIDSWSVLPAMRSGRANAMGGILGERLFVVGGESGGAALPTCEVLDREADTWVACPELTAPRAGGGATVLSDKRLYVVGGAEQPEAALGEIYDAETDLWQELLIPETTVSSTWSALAVEAVEARIFLLGGRQDDMLMRNNLVYSPFIHRTYLPSVGD
ncbi:MAG: LuxR C-terminal-related transcriptional regulator [Candidatus Promineifilaceae bacterium]|nr:LuxR C-terminal-related transcriptional regulator [Candidatus Promineifilaceae bacterium]